MSAVRPDPEVQAGRALRRLRLSRGWSQEEVARRMQAYGYDFHQTTIAKIEAAQRPLRVRELAHFAALYEVEAHELIYPVTGSLAEIDREIAEVEVVHDVVKQEAAAAAERLASARALLHDAQMAHAALSSKAAMLEGRLGFLRKEREKYAPWEGDEEPTSSDT